MFSGKNEYNKKTKLIPHETFHLIKQKIRLQGYDESVMVFRVVTDESCHIKYSQSRSLPFQNNTIQHVFTCPAYMLSHYFVA